MSFPLVSVDDVSNNLFGVPLTLTHYSGMATCMNRTSSLGATVGGFKNSLG